MSSSEKKAIAASALSLAVNTKRCLTKSFFTDLLKPGVRGSTQYSADKALRCLQTNCPTAWSSHCAALKRLDSRALPLVVKHHLAYFSNEIDVVACPNCSEPSLSTYGYCSLSCRSKASITTDVLARRKKTCRKRYGGNGPSCSPEVRAKQVASMQERYGVDNPSQSATIQAKKIATNQRKRGVDWAPQDPAVMRKCRETMLERHGAEFATQVPKFQAKTRRTNRKRYGVDNPSQNDEVKARTIATSTERYGAPVGSAPSIVAKRKATCLDVYGFENPYSSPDVQAHAKRLSQERHGTDYPRLNAEVNARAIRRSRKTCLETYGVRNPMHVPEIARRSHQTGVQTLEYDGQTFTGRSTYELRVFRALVRSGFQVSAGDTYQLAYFDPTRDKKRVYYPDLIARKVDKSIVIEVKSTYTLANDFATNVAKFRAANRFCRKNGMQFYLAVLIKGELHRIEFPTAAKARRLLSGHLSPDQLEKFGLTS